MPSNIEHENISAIKLGIVDMTRGYIGNQEVYPNTRSVTSAAFTNTSTLSNAGGTRTYRVSGALGAQYTLTGSNGASSPGAQTLSVSPTDYSISVSANNACGSSSRTPTITITPTGATALAGGVSSTSSFTQSGRASGTAHTMSMSTSIYDLNKITTTVNGVAYYAPGSTWTISYSWNIPSAINWGTTYWQYIFAQPYFTGNTGSTPGLYVTSGGVWSYTSLWAVYGSRISTGNTSSGTANFTVEYRTSSGGNYQPGYFRGIRLLGRGPVSWSSSNSCDTLNGYSYSDTPMHSYTSYLYA